MFFEDHNKVINVKDTFKGVQSVTVELICEDCEGQVNITDIMLQGGSISTVWEYHPSEIRWSHDG
jgi:hypothetical protein